MSQTTKGQPSVSSGIVRPSASLIVVNSRNEVLMVHRNSSGTFAKAHVFPGGNYDSDQDDSFVTTAVRETFEETGLLLVAPNKGKLPGDTELDIARDAIHSRKLMFGDFLKQHGLSVDEKSLLPFTQWITPPMVPKRFHTHFYVAFLNVVDSSGFSTGAKTERLPTPDKGQEVVAARFVRPSTAIQEFREQKIALVPPQFYLLTTLAEILQGSSNTAHQRAQVERLASSPFGRLVINPKRLPKEVEGKAVLTYEGDESRGGPPGRLHRSLVVWQKNGVATDIILQRNFDIFTEVEEPTVQTAKL